MYHVGAQGVDECMLNVHTQSSEEDSDSINHLNHPLTEFTY